MTDLTELARSARRAQRRLAVADGESRSAILRRLSTLLGDREAQLLEANARDLEAARRSDLAAPLLHRLALSAAKIATLREGVEQLAGELDPLGRARRVTELDEGLVLSQVTSPLGVLLVVFESRPDAVIQIGSLALRSGNAVLLKGGSEAGESNRALVACLRDALLGEGLDADAVVGIEGREAVAELLKLDDLVDLVIPRGSNALVRSIQESTRIPVLGHADGICHVYLDESADPDLAERILLDAKCGYPSACNAVETLLVHQSFLPHLARATRALTDAGVTLRADESARGVLSDADPVAEQDWSTEYGDLILAIRTVDSLDQAIEHIHRYGSAHTEAIVAEDTAASERFLAEVDSASVFVNASTRFADGFRYGLGAEVGISTGRIHARGPVGVEGLLTTRWLLRGQGQVAADYGPEGRTFRHRSLPTD